MARRTPLLEVKKKYFKQLSIRKFYPWLVYHKCEKCGDEFCREKMYICDEPTLFFTTNLYTYGCTHCFRSENEFRQYLEDKEIILTKEDFKEYNDKLMYLMVNR